MKIQENKICRFSIIVLLCIGINYAGVIVKGALQLPVWLDTIGTCLAAYYTNIYGAMISMVVVNLMEGIANPMAFPYIIIGIMLACAYRFCAKRGYMDEFTPAMIASFVIGVLTVVMATPLDIMFYQGYTGNIWGDALYDMLKFQGYPDIICTLADESVVNIVDKQICVFLAYQFIRRSNKRTIEKGKQSSLINHLHMLVICAVCASCLAPVIPQIVYADETKYINYYDYEKIIYNNTSGLPSSEANAIAETEDGYIWIGGYAGLTRYDGTRFEYITEVGISNVTEMVTDQEGRLWIGTNDHGLVVYEKGNFSFLTKEDGLPANAVRTLMTTADGSIYVGTTDEIARIDSNKQVTVLDDQLSGIVSMAENNSGLLVAINGNGTLFMLQNDKVIGTFASMDRAVSYTSVYATGDDFYIGTTGGYLLCAQVQKATLQITKKIPCYLLSGVMRIQQDSNDAIWLCGDKGIGYLDETNRVNMLKYSGFDSSVESMMQDYEGNYWFASSRFGVLKLCKNIFVNIHENSVLEGTVVNAVTEFQGKLYCATDSGLQIIEPVTRKVIRNQLADRLGNVRIRFLQVDSMNRMWICCYGGEGLVCYSADGTIQTYNEENNGTAGDRFRCMLELTDGTVVAGSSEGITFIENGKVTGVLTERDGLTTTQILSLAEGPDGTVYAGSDGSGIYVIRDGKVQEILTEEEGLTSLIILRMTPYNNGYFVVTSNSLSYMENNQIRKIEQFPYFNNYDVLIHEGKAWILSSRGIFVADPENLLSEEKIKYQLFDQSNGMRNSITANSWTYIDEEDKLHFCTNNGVETISMTDNYTYDGNYKMQIGNFMADETVIKPENGVYTVASEVERISITPSICNYTLTDLKVCAYIEGLDSKPVIVRQSTLDTLTYTNVPHGTYTLYLQIYDNSEEKIVQQSTYTIVKEAELWETVYFNIYLTGVLLWIGAFVTWVFSSLRQMLKRRQELETMSIELEKRVNEQTAEIKEKSKKMEAMQWGVIESMASLIESRDGNTGEHVRNTSAYVRMLAEEMKRRNLYPEILTKQFVKVAAKVAPLHDVGKIKISDVILNKPGRFTPEEFEIMKTHAALGGQIVDDI